MKSINETFWDSEMNKLNSLKNAYGLNWHDFIMLLARPGIVAKAMQERNKHETKKDKR